MRIIQPPISKNHKSAMFFNGIIAINKSFVLETFQDGEITYDGELFIGEDIIELGKHGLISDSDIDDEKSSDVGINVDKFITITYPNGELLDDELMFDNYDEALKEFNEHKL